jgi:hypothetical protein
MPRYNRRKLNQSRITRVMQRGCCVCGANLLSNRVAFSLNEERGVFCEVHVKTHTTNLDRETLVSQLRGLEVVYASCPLPIQEQD